MNGIPSHFSILERQLAVTNLRHQVVSKNIANVNTPGYKAKYVSDSDAADPASFHVIHEQVGGPTRQDGNTVDIDKEIGALKVSALQHNAYTQILAAKVRQMRSAISGG